MNDMNEFDRQLEPFVRMAAGVGSMTGTDAFNAVASVDRLACKLKEIYDREITAVVNRVFSDLPHYQKVICRCNPKYDRIHIYVPELSITDKCIRICSYKTGGSVSSVSMAIEGISVDMLNPDPKELCLVEIYVRLCSDRALRETVCRFMEAMPLLEEKVRSLWKMFSDRLEYLTRSESVDSRFMELKKEQRRYLDAIRWADRKTCLVRIREYKPGYEVPEPTGMTYGGMSCHICPDVTGQFYCEEGKEWNVESSEPSLYEDRWVSPWELRGLDGGRMFCVCDL